jgi:exopolysaccharide biosynthesis polyprenyl glycosylphosphotransferase
MSERLSIRPIGAEGSARPPLTVPLRVPRLVAGGNWRTRYVRLLAAGDLVVLLLALTVAAVVRFGAQAVQVTVGGLSLPYASLAVVMAGVWWMALNLTRTRSPRLIGHGTEEYRRVVRATWAAFAGLAMVSVALKVDASRAYIAVAFPLGLVGLLAWRKAARAQLHRRRRHGVGLANVLLVGGLESAYRINSYLSRQPQSGYRVGGVWIPDIDVVDGLDRSRCKVPVLGRQHTLAGMIRRTQAEAVMVTDTEHLGPEGLRELAWQLEGTGIELMLSPNVIDVVGSRLHLHEVSGLPMLHLDEPQYAGASRFMKMAFDRLGACLILLAFAPVMLTLAAIVKLTSEGPVFYRQERIGKGGATFGMIKFRSMRVGADAELAALLAAEGKSLAELPKLENDPRITKVGGVMRRYSLDELPQLLNVLKGDMSLVGPRPQRDFEVEQYDHVADRRLTVRPGMTGLWQVSGRSDLDFAESIRLDVHYVENWSMTADLILLWKTLRAVVRPDGAY